MTGLHISYKNQRLLFSQLSNLLNSGVSIRRALESVGNPSAPKSVQKFTQELIDQIEQGSEMHPVFRKYEQTFPTATPALVQLGEQSGHLDEMFDKISSMLDTSIRLRSKTVTAMLYPGFLILLASFLLPLWKLFKAGGPDWQEYLSWNVYPISITALALVLFYRLKQWLGGLKPVQYIFDGFVLNIPLLGGAFKKLAYSRVCRTLGFTYGSGMELNSVMSLASKASGNVILQRKLNQAFRKWRQTGGRLSDHIAGVRDMPRSVVEMFRSGEETGNLDDMMFRAGRNLEEEAETTLQRFTKLIGPVILLLALLVLAFLIFNFYNRLFSSFSGLS